MSLRSTLRGTASRFMHLTGGIAAAKPAEESTVADDDATVQAEEDGSEDEAATPPKGKKNVKKKPAGDDDGEDDDEDEAGEDDEEESGESDDMKKGRKAERDRAARIFASAAAARNPGLAAHFAFDTNMSSAAAIASLRLAAPPVQPLAASPSRPLAAAMDRLPRNAIGPDGNAGPQDEAGKLAAGILKAAAVTGRVRDIK